MLKALKASTMCAAAAPPPPPEETRAQPGAQSQPQEQAKLQQTQASIQTRVPRTAVDVSQDEVLQEWSHSSDELKRQWAAWYMSNPSEWIEYKSQYTMSQQQQQQQQSHPVPTSHSLPQAAAQTNPDRGDALQHGPAQMPQPQQQPPQSHSPQQQHPEPFHQPSLQPASSQQPPPWQQPPWQHQQPHQYHEQAPYRLPTSTTQTPHWPLASSPQLDPRQAQPPQPVGTTAAAAPAQALQQRHQHYSQQPPWAAPAPQRDGTHSQTHQHPPYQEPATIATPNTGPVGTARDSSSPPWQSPRQPPGSAAHPPPARDAHAHNFSSWAGEHAAGQVYGSWDGATTGASRGGHGAATQAPLQHPGGPSPAAPRPGSSPERHRGEQRPGADAASAPGPRNGFAGATRRVPSSTDSAADQPPAAAAKQTLAQHHGGERQVGFVRGGRHKPRPPPASVHGSPWGAGGVGGPAQGHGWRPGQKPAGPPGLGDGATPAFAGDPTAAMHSSPQPAAAASPHDQGPASTPAVTVPQPHGPPAPQQWPTQSALPQRHLAVDGGMPPPAWHPHMALRGPAAPPVRAADSGPAAAAPRPWHPRPPAQAPPPRDAMPPAPPRWQLPAPAGAPRANAGPAPLQGHPPAAPAPLGPPRPLVGGLSHAPPGVPKPADATPPAIQQLPRPGPGNGQLQDGAARPALPPAPPPRSPVQPGGLFLSHSGSPRPRHEHGPGTTMPTASPPPRPGRLYGMHSPQPSPCAPEPAGPRNGLVGRPVQVQPNVVQFSGSNGAGVQPMNASQGGSVHARPHGGGPNAGEGLAGPGVLQARGPRPPMYGPGPQAVPGMQYQGLPLARLQNDFVNGPRGPRAGPGMLVPPARPSLPYMSQYGHPRPSF